MSLTMRFNLKRACEKLAKLSEGFNFDLLDDNITFNISDDDIWKLMLLTKYSEPDVISVLDAKYDHILSNQEIIKNALYWIGLLVPYDDCEMDVDITSDEIILKLSLCYEGFIESAEKHNLKNPDNTVPIEAYYLVYLLDCNFSKLEWSIELYGTYKPKYGMVDQAELDMLSIISKNNDTLYKYPFSSSVRSLSKYVGNTNKSSNRINTELYESFNTIFWEFIDRESNFIEEQIILHLDDYCDDHNSYYDY